MAQQSNSLCHRTSTELQGGKIRRRFRLSLTRNLEFYIEKLKQDYEDRKPLCNRLILVDKVFGLFLL